MFDSLLILFIHMDVMIELGERKRNMQEEYFDKRLNDLLLDEIPRERG